MLDSRMLDDGMLDDDVPLFPILHLSPDPERSTIVEVDSPDPLRSTIVEAA